MSSKINQKELFEYDETSIQDIEDIRHKKKKHKQLISERKPFTFNGIPTY